MFIIYLVRTCESTKILLCALHLRTNPLQQPDTFPTRKQHALTVRHANTGLFWGNLAAIFHTYIHYLCIQIRCTALRFPKHRSCHGTPPRKQTSYATELQCPGRDKRDTVYIHKHTRAQTV